jgi:hypothetical protein
MHRKLLKKILPRGTTKKKVFDKFEQFLWEENRHFNITYKYFCRVWQDKCSHLLIMARGSDFCDLCKFFYECTSTTEEMGAILQSHKDSAKKEREFYYNQCKMSQNTYRLNMLGVSNTVGSIHMTFDFAQSVHIPFFLRQPGSYYFKIGM